MTNLLRTLRSRVFRSRSGHVFRDEQGATAVEYAVMLAMIVLACIGTIITLGQSTANSWSDTTTKMTSAGLGS